MKIVIVGAGEVGVHIASSLVREGHDLVVIDRDAAKVSQLQSSMDILAVVGDGCVVGREPFAHAPSWARFSILLSRGWAEEIAVERTISQRTNLPDCRPQTTWRRRGLEGQAGASDTHQIYEPTAD